MVAVAGTAMVALAATSMAIPGASADSGKAAATSNKKTTSKKTTSSKKTLSNHPVPLQEMTIPGGGYFYTLNADGARQAAKQNKFSPQPGHRAYLYREHAKGTAPLHRLRYTGSGDGYVVSGKPAEWKKLAARKDFVDEGRLGYGFAKKHAGTVAIHRLSNHHKWRLVPKSQVSKLVAKGWHDDGVTTWAKPHHVRAGAIYFGQWDDHPSWKTKATKKLYGRSNDWWGGVRDYASPKATDHDADKYIKHWRKKNPKHADFSDRKPAIGYYDDTKRSALESQIKQATGAGLDFFSFYWYWGAKKHKQTTDGGLDTFLKARNSNAMDYMVNLCAPPPSADDDMHLPKSDFNKAAQSIVDKYLGKKNYLRDNSGRPIVQLCDHRGIGDAKADSAKQSQQTVQFEKILRKKAKSQLGENLLMLGNDNLMRSSKQGTNGLVSRLKLNGTACMGFFDGNGPKSYSTYMRKAAANRNVAPQTYGRCAQHDFDERPRYPVHNNKAGDIRYYTDSSPKRYGNELDALNSDINRSRHMSSIDNFAWLYAWNEWAEGGYLEPNAANGCKLLDITQQHLGLSGKGCKAHP